MKLQRMLRRFDFDALTIDRFTLDGRDADNELSWPEAHNSSSRDGATVAEQEECHPAAMIMAFFLILFL